MDWFRRYKKDILIVGYICLAVVLISAAGGRNIERKALPSIGGNDVIYEPIIGPTVAPIEQPIAEELITNVSTNCVQELSRSFIGIREQGGNNRGKEVLMFSARFGNKTPVAWCTFFTCYVLDSCGIDNPRTGWTPSLATYRGGKIIYQRNKFGKIVYKKNCAGTLYYSNLKREGHSFIIDGVTDKSVVTVEGNTTMAGSRETTDGKDGVRQLWRPKTIIYRIIEFKEKE